MNDTMLRKRVSPERIQCDAGKGDCAAATSLSPKSAPQALAFLNRLL
jgi:hypothetical protein